MQTKHYDFKVEPSGKLKLLKRDERLLIKVMSDGGIKLRNYFSVLCCLYGLHKLIDFFYYDAETFSMYWFLIFAFQLLFAVGIVRGFILDTFGHLELELTRRGVSLSLRWRALRNVCTVAHIPIRKLERRFEIPQSATSADRDRITSQLRLYAGKEVFKLTEHSKALRTAKIYEMTQEEQNWVASELSDWLNLPVEEEWVAV